MRNLSGSPKTVQKFSFLEVFQKQYRGSRERMSRNKTIILILLGLILTGCALKNKISLQKEPKEAIKANEIKIFKPKIDEKKYKELSLLLEALYIKYQNPHATDYDIFYKLYKVTKNPDYLYEAARDIITYKPKDIDKAIKIIKEGLKDNPDNEKLNKMLASLYLKNNQFKEALTISQKLLKKRKIKKYYIFNAISYLGLRDFKRAVKYYKKAYEISPDVEILNQIATILYQFMDKKEEAVNLIKEYIAKHGCDYYICEKLAQIYLNNKDLSNAIDIYKKIYEKYKEKKILRKITELYLFKNEYKEAINYIISTGGNEDLLIEIYIAKKDYKKAYNVAKRFYEKSKNPKILAKLAILEYEKAKIKDKKLLKKVIEKFKKSLPFLSPFDKENSLYYNYYGYLLIDHDIDVKKGIEYVKKALELEPASIYYLDSLAWGYYKLKKCKKAYEIMDKIVDKTNEKEIIDHYKKIKKCIKKEDKI